MSVSGGCCVVVGGGGGGRGAKPRVGGCALGVGRCVFRGLGQDFAKMVHFRPSENLDNNFRQHVVLLEYLPTRYCFSSVTGSVEAAKSITATTQVLSSASKNIPVAGRPITRGWCALLHL